MIGQVDPNWSKHREADSKQKSGRKDDFLELFQKEQAKGMTARQYLSTLTPKELSALQKGSRFGAPVNIIGISEEGARNLLAEGQASHPANRIKVQPGPGSGNSSVWDELSRKYDVHNATVDEMNIISMKLYCMGQISFLDHANLSFNPAKSPQQIKGTIFLTPVDSGRRDWIAEYQARAELALRSGDSRSCHRDKHIGEILERLESETGREKREKWGDPKMVGLKWKLANGDFKEIFNRDPNFGFHYHYHHDYVRMWRKHEFDRA